MRTCFYKRIVLVVWRRKASVSPMSLPLALELSTRVCARTVSRARGRIDVG